MELTKQVVSLELAKRLKELGVPQGDWESASPLFYWSFYDGGARRDKPKLIPVDDCNFGFMEDLVAAFTVAELGEMFLGQIISFEHRRDGKYRVWWYGSPKTMIEQRMHNIDGDTEADARAAMLVYLLENKLLPVTEK